METKTRFKLKAHLLHMISQINKILKIFTCLSFTDSLAYLLERGCIWYLSIIFFKLMPHSAFVCHINLLQDTVKSMQMMTQIDSFNSTSLEDMQAKITENICVR